MSSWINIVVVWNVSWNYISCLDCLSRSLSNRFASCCFQSYIHISCRSTQNDACIRWVWCFRSKMQTKMILRPLPNSAHSNTDSLYCKFEAWQNSEVAKLTGNFVNWIKIRFFLNVFAQSPLLPMLTTQQQKNLIEQVNSLDKDVLCFFHFYNLL